MPRPFLQNTAAGSQPRKNPRLLERWGAQLGARVARSCDEAFALTALEPPRIMKRRSPAESLGHDARMRGLQLIAAFYARDEFLSRHNALFPSPEPITLTIRRVRGFPVSRVAFGSSARGAARGEIVDLSWASDFEPLWTDQSVAQRFSELPAEERARLHIEPSSLGSALRELGIDKNGSLRDKYLAVVPNRTAHARWYRHDDGPRPCAVLVHGYMGGPYALETRMWPIAKLLARGFDVILTMLPFHGPRRTNNRRYLPPAFPSNDPRFTVEGFRQVVFDHRALFAHLLGSGAVASLGIMGMSLGGYSAALLSTLEESLRFSVLFVPLAAIDEFAFEHGRMVGSDTQQRAQRDALRAAQWAVSPLARPSVVPPPRVVVLAGEADRVTGLGHAERLRAHFDAKLVTFGGGHLLHFGKGRAFEPVFDVIGAGIS